MKHSDLRLGLEVMVNKKSAKGAVRRIGTIVSIPTEKSCVRRCGVKWMRTNKITYPIFSRLVLAPEPYNTYN